MAKSDGGLAWVDAMLARWGRWSIRSGSSGLGYAKCSILAGAGNGDGHCDPAPPRDVTEDDFDAIDAAVMRLPLVQLSCVVVVYIHLAGCSSAKQAMRLGIDRKALTKYIGDAQRKIAVDISVDVPQNSRQSVIGRNASAKNQPVAA